MYNSSIMRMSQYIITNFTQHKNSAEINSLWHDMQGTTIYHMIRCKTMMHYMHLTTGSFFMDRMQNNELSHYCMI